MKKYLIISIIISIFTAQFCFGQAKKVVEDSAKFNKILFKNINSFTFNGQKPTGNGWNILEKHFTDNQFVAWGEYHNSTLVSQLSTYALEVASKQGFKNWCVEISPFVATELTRIAKTKSPFDTIMAINKGKGDYGIFPFFKTKEDLAMVVTANKHNFQIWGIDQEFQMTFPYCLDKIYKVQTPKIKLQYKAVYDSLMAKWWSPPTKLLDSLKNGIPQKYLKIVLEDVKTSKIIYNEDNSLMRANLMKKNFYNYYDNAKTKNEKVFFKMGANHLAKGLNLMTHLYDVGNAAYELSERNQTKFTNVFFIIRYETDKGKIIDDLENPNSDYPKEFLKLYDKEKWVVVDLRPLRVRYNNDKTLTENTYKIIDKYDFIVVSPEVAK